MNVVVLGSVSSSAGARARYLIWYMTADQNQLMHVKIGKAPNIGAYTRSTRPTALRGDHPGRAPGAPPPAPLPPATRLADPHHATTPEPSADPLPPPTLPGGDAETF